MIHGDFNACVEDETLGTCKSYSFNSLIKQPTCFKNPKNPSCIDLILTNKFHLFQTKCVIEAGLSYFYRMTISILKIHFQKLPPKIIKYKDFKKFGNESFMIFLQYTLSEELKNKLITSKTWTHFVKFFIVFLTITHPEKKVCSGK